MANANKAQRIEMVEVNVKHATISIQGEGDIVLNKTSASSARELTASDRKSQRLWNKQHENKWEDVITSIHWRDGIPCEDTNEECTEEMFETLLRDNAPCITAFGLKKSWCQALTRNEVDKYGTKFDAAVNIVSNKGLIPIKFAQHYINTRLMSPQKGSPITVNLNHFSGWSADIPIIYTDNVYSINEIVTIINLAGFGVGIGSGRTSGFGRYKVVDVK